VATKKPQQEENLTIIDEKIDRGGLPGED